MKLGSMECRKVTKPDFRKKKCGGPNLGKKGPNWAKNEVSLDKKSLEFASIAYGNRERWYLGGGSGQSAEKKCWAFVWGIICQKGTTKCGAVAQFSVEQLFLLSC